MEFPKLQAKTTGQRRIVAYLDDLPPIGDLRQAKVNGLRELQSANEEKQLRFMSQVKVFHTGFGMWRHEEEFEPKSRQWWGQYQALAKAITEAREKLEE